MPEEKCPEFERLQAAGHAVLKHLGELAAAQLAAFDKDDVAEFTRLDRELELTVGSKERTIGALRQHAMEHGCKRPYLVDTQE